MQTGIAQKHKKNPSESHLLALISSRNVGMRGHSRKGIILLEHQCVGFGIKAGTQFEILN